MTKLESRKNEVWMIWPEDAEKMLAKNYGKNRKLSDAQVAKYAADMANGKWGDTPSPIVITKGGILLDGQHRLKAVTEANVPVVFEVRIVPDDNLYDYLDNGKARTVRDYVTVKNKSITTGVAVFAYCAKYGRQGISGCYDGTLYRFRKDNGKDVPVRADRMGVAAYANEHKEGLERIALMAMKMRNAMGAGSKKAIGVFLWLAAMFNDVDLTEEFADEFCKAAPDSKSVNAAKNTLMRANNAKTRVTKDWIIGTLLAVYENFVDCTGKTSFSNWEKVLERYEERMIAARGKGDENDA